MEIVIPLASSTDMSIDPAAQINVANLVETGLADVSAMMTAVAAEVPGLELADLEVTEDPETEFQAEVIVRHIGQQRCSCCGAVGRKVSGCSCRGGKSHVCLRRQAAEQDPCQPA